MLDDAELERIAKDARRRPDAFGLLYDELYDPVYRFVHGRVGSIHTAEDITADVFTQAFAGIRRYRRRRGSGVRGWIFRIARNDVVDHFRRSDRRPLAPIEEALAMVADDDPEQRAMDQVEVGRVMRVLDRLSDDQRDIVLLRYAADLTHADIGRAVGKTEGAVRVALHRAMRTIETLLEDPDER